MTASPMTPKPEPLREKIARIVDPDAWAYRDNFFSRNGRYPKGLADGTHRSLAKADAILALTLPASQGGVAERRARHIKTLTDLANDPELFDMVAAHEPECIEKLRAWLFAVPPLPEGNQDLSVSQDQGQGPCADAVPLPAPSRKGHVDWYSSDGESYPDVGLSVCLGDGLTLYMGELANLTVAESGIDPSDYAASWWIALEGRSMEVVAAVADVDAARTLFDVLCAAIGPARSETGETLRHVDDYNDPVLIGLAKEDAERELLEAAMAALDWLPAITTPGAATRRRLSKALEAFKSETA